MGRHPRSSRGWGAKSIVQVLPCLLRRMVSAFGSGAAFSLVSGMSTGSKLQGAFTTGVLFALFQGAFYQAGGTIPLNRYNAVLHRLSAQEVFSGSHTVAWLVAPPLLCM